MDFKSIANLIKKDAPLFAQIIGHANPLAGILINIIMAALNVNNPTELKTKIESDCGCSEKIKQLELEHKMWVEKYHNQDILGARQREGLLINKTRKIDWFMRILATSTLVMIAFMFFMIYTNHLDEENCKIGSIMDHLLKYSDVMIRYYFG